MVSDRPSSGVVLVVGSEEIEHLVFQLLVDLAELDRDDSLRITEYTGIKVHGVQLWADLVHILGPVGEFVFLKPPVTEGALLEELVVGDEPELGVAHPESCFVRGEEQDVLVRVHVFDDASVVVAPDVVVDLLDVGREVDDRTDDGEGSVRSERTPEHQSLLRLTLDEQLVLVEGLVTWLVLRLRRAETRGK